MLRTAPPGADGFPVYYEGWVVGTDERAPFLSYTAAASVNWSDELEQLHEESSRTHFLDVWSREAILAAIGVLPASPTIADLGCSTGYLLEDLEQRHPDAVLVGVDLVAAGLRKAHELVPSARLLQADVCDLPLTDAGFDAVVSANLLEHVPDDRRALAEIARILRVGARAAVVVPAGPGTYDYYDRFLGHERRYGRGQLAANAREAGLRVLADRYIASLIYPAFWLVKQRNRRRFDHLRGEELAQRVALDIRRTSNSVVGAVLRRVEEGLGLRLPFGIRNLVVLQKKEG